MLLFVDLIDTITPIIIEQVNHNTNKKFIEAIKENVQYIY